MSCRTDRVRRVAGAWILAVGASACRDRVVSTHGSVAPVIASFAAQPTTIVVDTSTAITWSWSFANTPMPDPTCVIDHGVGQLASGASASVTLSEDTPFTLTCTNGAGSDTAEAAIATAAAAVAPVLADFAAQPTTLVGGVATDVIWAWSYSNTPVPTPACVIAPDVGALTSGGIALVTLVADTDFTVSCSNDAGADDLTTRLIVGLVPAQPSVIAGDATLCAGTSGVNYAVDDVPGVSYAWSYDGTGVSILSGQATSSISVGYAANATSGSWSVTPSNLYGDGASRTLAVSVTGVPAQPSVVTGSASVCAGDGGVGYGVTDVPGVSYAWSYDGTGASLVSGQGTNSIAVDYASDATAGSWTVTPSNSCGDGSTRSLAVVVVTVPAQPNSISGSASVFSGTSGVAYAVTDVPGVSYAWSYSGSGASVTSGQGTHGISASYALNATSGMWTVTPSGACGDGVARTLDVTVSPLASCTGALGDCDVNATCTDVGGGDLRCVCRLGYSGDGATCTGVTSVDLVVPIEMTQISLGSSTADLVFPQSSTSLNTDDYDGTVTYELDIVARNTDMVDHVVSIVDAANASCGDITVPAATAARTRLRTTFTPTPGANIYRLKLPGTTTTSLVQVSAARIVVRQIGATRTRLYYPLINGAQDYFAVSATDGGTVGNVPPEQKYPQYHAAFRKNAAAYGELAPGTPWTFDAVINTPSSSCPANAKLFNLQTGVAAGGSVSTTSATPVLLTSASFADNAANFTEGDDFGVKIGALTCGYGAIYKAGLWLRLVPLRRGEVCYRVSAEYGLLPPTPPLGYYDFHRHAVELTAFSNPVASFQWDAWRGGSSGTTTIGLTDCGANDVGACTLIAAATLGATFADYALLRSPPLSLTSGNRFAVAGLGSYYLRNACLFVGFAE
ncbi:MAG: EGF domain-containing protein [Myxococcota bacterium]